MRRRTLYVLMFAPPVLLAATIVSGLVLALLLAIFWAFVFGDNTWPTAAYATLVIAAVASFLGVCAILLSLAYDAGRSAEARPSLNPAPVVLSAGALALLVLLALAVFRYFWSS